MIQPRRLVVVDASAVAAVLFGEPRGPEVARRLENARLVAPALLWFELASVCARKMRRHGDQAEQIRQAFGLLERLSIEPVEVNHSAVVELALETGLSTYDAAYLWLSRRLDTDLETLDERLREQCG